MPETDSNSRPKKLKRAFAQGILGQFLAIVLVIPFLLLLGLAVFESAYYWLLLIIFVLLCYYLIKLIERKFPLFSNKRKEDK